ncbi:hypothetical protein GCM10027517_20270 [Phycicoccus ginsengisoli]
MSTLVDRVAGARFADGSSCDVELWLDPAPVPPGTVFAAMVVLRDGDGLCAALWSPRRQEWGIPGGWREDGESVAECAVREVWEETGVRLDPGDLVPVGHEDFHPLPGVRGRWPAEGGSMQLYAARLAGPGPALVAGEPDAVDPQWLQPEELRARSGGQFWWPMVAGVLAL